MGINVHFILLQSLLGISQSQLRPDFCLYRTFSHPNRETQLVSKTFQFACFTFWITTIIIMWQWRVHVVTTQWFHPWWPETPVNQAQKPTWQSGRCLPNTPVVTGANCLSLYTVLKVQVVWEHTVSTLLTRVDQLITFKMTLRSTILFTFRSLSVEICCTPLKTQANFNIKFES